MGSLKLENFAQDPLTRNMCYLIEIELKVSELETNYQKFRKTNLDDGHPTFRRKTPRITFA
jgi:hypothetical protein